MSGMIERWILFGIVAISFLCAWRASAEPQVVIKKVFDHRAPDAMSLELGSCVVYGGGLTKGSVTEISRVVGGREERIFTIPRGVLQDSSCKQMVNTINSREARAGYQLKIEYNTTPNSGLSLRFSYPKDHCVISYKPIDSIQREKGIVFNVYNHSLVRTLKKQQNPVIRTVATEQSPIIFIDPGHGGIDTGAVARSGISEKEVCLSVAHELQTFLHDFGYTVHLSRDDDTDVPLDVRTGMASQCGADVVVSLHANAAENNSACGCEIFFLDPHYVEEQSPIPKPLYTMVIAHHDHRNMHSKQLAAAIHQVVCKQLPRANKQFKDRGIKSAVSQLLLGVYRPAVLIEMGFLTHPYESHLLATFEYQRLVAQSIASGIHTYCLNMQL